MKKIFNLVALVCLVAVVCAGCKPKNDFKVLDLEVMYIVSMVVEVQLQDSVQGDADLDAIAGAMTAVGVRPGYELEVEGNDSLDVANKVQVMVNTIDQTLQTLPGNTSGKLVVRAIDKKFKEAAENNDKSHPVRIWHKKNFGPPMNALYMKGLHSGLDHQLRWVKDIHTMESGTKLESAYKAVFGVSSNYCEDGKDISLVLEHSGVAGNEKDEFKWEVEAKYITDVIAVYGKTQPDVMTVEGREYRLLSHVDDLNMGNSGVLTRLYATTEPVEGFENFYLITGYAPKVDYLDCQCRMLTDNKLFQADIELKEAGKIFAIDGVDEHKFVERVVKAYNADGSYVDELDTNYGMKCDNCVRMILTYASK